MARTGMTYYYDKANLSNDDIAFYYNFNNSGDLSSSISGSGFSLFGDTGSFWSSSGSGFFSGTILKTNFDNFDSEEFCSLLIFEKTQTGNAVLISTLSTGIGGISGFILGINDANKAYLTAYDSENEYYITNTANLNLGRSNGLSINKSDNIFTLGKFNFFDKNLYEDQLVFPDGCNTNFSNLYFGATSGAPTDITDGYFEGYLDEFLGLNVSILSNSIEDVYKGFYKIEPVTSVELIYEADSYSYPSSNSLSQPVWEEMQSGALDYIRTNIFNTTGVGSIRVINSGTIVNGTGYVSGNLSGTVSLKTGYYQVTTGSGVTGYITSGLIASASGIVDYVDVSIYPITVFTSGDIYQLSAKSGITGVTAWESVFSGALYETILTTGLVEDQLDTEYLLNFSYMITGLSGDATYLHLADYSNNGSNNIVIAHDLDYSGDLGIAFRAFKTTQLLYGSVTRERNDDMFFIDQFSLDGVVLKQPIKSGDILELIEPEIGLLELSGSYNFNKNQNINLVSGYFAYTGTINSNEDVSLYINGIYQNPFIDLDNLLWLEDLEGAIVLEDAETYLAVEY